MATKANKITRKARYTTMMTPLDSLDLYMFLNLEPSATHEEIEQSYNNYLASLQKHPDDSMLMFVNFAHKTLTNDAARKNYDARYEKEHAKKELLPVIIYNQHLHSFRTEHLTICTNIYDPQSYSKDGTYYAIETKSAEGFTLTFIPNKPSHPTNNQKTNKKNHSLKFFTIIFITIFAILVAFFCNWYFNTPNNMHVDSPNINNIEDIENYNLPPVYSPLPKIELPEELLDLAEN